MLIGDESQQLESCVQVEKRYHMLYKELCLSPEQESRAAGLWSAWRAQRKALDLPFHRCLLSLCSLSPTPFPSPDLSALLAAHGAPLVPHGGVPGTTPTCPSPAPTPARHRSRSSCGPSGMHVVASEVDAVSSSNTAGAVAPWDGVHTQGGHLREHEACSSAAQVPGMFMSAVNCNV